MLWKFVICEKFSKFCTVKQFCELLHPCLAEHFPEEPVGFMQGFLVNPVKCSLAETVKHA